MGPPLAQLVLRQHRHLLRAVAGALVLGSSHWIEPGRLVRAVPCRYPRARHPPGRLDNPDGVDRGRWHWNRAAPGRLGVVCIVRGGRRGAGILGLEVLHAPGFRSRGRGHHRRRVPDVAGGQLLRGRGGRTDVHRDRGRGLRPDQPAPGHPSAGTEAPVGRAGQAKRGVGPDAEQQRQVAQDRSHQGQPRAQRSGQVPADSRPDRPIAHAKPAAGTATHALARHRGVPGAHGTARPADRPGPHRQRAGQVGRRRPPARAVPRGDDQGPKPAGLRGIHRL
jgi:hypothetical protein